MFVLGIGVIRVLVLQKGTAWLKPRGWIKRHLKSNDKAQTFTGAVQSTGGETMWFSTGQVAALQIACAKSFQSFYQTDCKKWQKSTWKLINQI